MLDELHLDDRKRHSKFHGNDSLISVEDLWNSWKQSKGLCLLKTICSPLLAVFFLLAT